MSLTELRTVQLDIAEQVVQFCNRFGLPIWLSYGSLLGAIRHGGYIPWDDDIDLMMLRDDYVRFGREFAAAATGPFLLGADATVSTWPHPFIKVFDARTVQHEPTTSRLHLGVNVDIFPIDSHPSHIGFRRVQFATVELLRVMTDLRIAPPGAGSTRLRKAVVRAGHWMLQPLPIRLLPRMWSRCASLRSLRPGDSVGVHYGAHTPFSVSVEALLPGASRPFEDRLLPVPQDPHAVLQSMYGDYLTPPEAGKQRTHHSYLAHWGRCD